MDLVRWWGSMAVSIYKNGVWAKPTTIQRYVNGTWVSCQFVKRYENGAWIDVWSASQSFTLFNTNLGTGATYTLTPSTDNTALTYTLAGAGVTNNSVVLAVYDTNGFGNSVRIQYTLEQAVATTGFGGTYFMGDDYSTILTGQDRAISYATAFDATVSVNNPKVLYLLIDTVSGYTISGVIRDVYINTKLITFK
jgi:hypothetical protein